MAACRALPGFCGRRRGACGADSTAGQWDELTWPRLSQVDDKQTEQVLQLPAHISMAGNK